MPALGREQWQALSPYLDQALEIPAGERSAWLDTLRTQDPSLAEDLQMLLNEHDALEAQGFLQERVAPIPRPPSLTQQTIGAYALESAIGQGGMGTVWLARRSDGRFEGRAAVKFLNIGLLGQGGEARFKREGNILARLAHPNIAHLIDAGVSSAGQPYLVLEYVEGQHIDTYSKEHALDTQARLVLFLEVTAAVAHAHASLIVHRDIKPSNVLVTKAGHVKLLDFGIAKLLEDDAPSALATALTREGGTALTLAYAAPEQVIGGAITTGTDVYALGLLLYLLLAGKHPVESRLHSHAELIHAIVEIEAPRLSDTVASDSKLKRVLRGDLDTMVAKALKKRIERDFALRQLSRAEAINDLNAFVLSDAAPSGKPFTVNDLLARAEQLVARQREADDLNRTQLLTSIGAQYLDLGEYANGRRVLEQAYALAQKLPSPSIRGRASCSLAKALANQGDLPRAERLIEEGLREVEHDARFGLDRAICLQSGSEVAVRHGQSRDAIARGKGAQLALKQSPFQPEGLELDNLITLANAFRNAGQVREASAAFEQASARLSALGRDNTQRAALLLNNWGLALSVWGRPLDAERVLRRTIALSQDDRAQTTVPAMPLINYARALKELDRLDEAAEYAERGYAKGLAAGDQSVVLNSLMMRAIIYRSQGKLEQAAQILSEIEPTLRRSLPAGHIAFPSLTMQRALIAQARGEAQSALNLADQAVAAVEASLKEGREGADYLRNFLLWRSPIQLQAGHPDQAASDARRVLKLFLEATESGTFSVTLGRAYVALGRALQTQGKIDEARVAFRSAVEHMKSAVGPDHAETQDARKLAELDTPLR